MKTTVIFLRKYFNKKYFLVIIFVSPIFLIYGQVSDYSWQSLFNDPSQFYSDVNSYTDYIHSTYPDSIPKDKRGDIKSAFRFFNFWNQRLGIVNGKLSYQPYNYLVQNNSLNPVCSGTDNAQWELIGPDHYDTQWLGLVQAVLNDPNNPGTYILSTENGGIWKNNASGVIWENKTDNLKFPGINATEIIRSPLDPNHLFASTSGGLAVTYGLGIIESTDNGETWFVNTNFPNQSLPRVVKVIFDPNNGLTLYAATETKLYVSQNTGQTWSLFNQQPPLNTSKFNSIRDIEIADNGDIFLTSSAAYSRDGQALRCHILNGIGIWEDLTINGNLPTDFQKAKISTPIDGKIFLLDDCGGNNHLYKTTDYGDSWDLVCSDNTFNFLETASWEDEVEYSRASGIIYIGNHDVHCFKENAFNVGSDIRGIDHYDIRHFDFIGIENGYEKLLVATDGGITLLTVKISHVTETTTENLNGQHLPIGNFLGIGVSHTKPEFVIGGTTHCATHKLESGAWSVISGGDGGDCEVNWEDPTYYYYQQNYEMFRSHQTTPIYNDNLNGNLGTKIKLNPIDPYIVYFGRSSYKTGNPPNIVIHPAKFVIYNEHNNAIITHNVPDEMNAVGAIAVNSDNKIYISDFQGADATIANRLIYSTDNGITWQDLSDDSVYGKNGNNWVYINKLRNVLYYKPIGNILINPNDNNEMWISIGGIIIWNGVPQDAYCRVLHSTDEGETWYDFSENLTAFPVIALEYQSGSNNRIFAGTDAGIYYRDASMSQWECFNTGMPVTVVSELNYEPCSKYLYASTYCRAVFKTPVAFVDNPLLLPTNSNITWSTIKEIGSDILIPNSATLTITGTIYMSKNNKIIIQPGGKLIVDGGTITCRCGLWQGIVVLGNPNYSQYPDPNGLLHQGYLEVKNNSTISNAREAIRLWDGSDYSTTGGIVKGNASTFKNCRRVADFNFYQNFIPTTGQHVGNLSYFYNCNFLQDDNYPGIVTDPFFAFVSMSRVDDINFIGCNFINSTTVSSDPYRGYGIYTIDASFIVKPICTGNYLPPCPENHLIKSTFQGLYAGICALLSGLNAKTVTVNSAQFTDNGYGVQLNSINYLTIINSYFDIGANTNCPDFTGIGIDLTNCNGYCIEDNHFYHTSGGPTPAYYIGIRVNTPQQPVDVMYNEIYNNYFSGLYEGNLAEGYNINVNNQTKGLCYFCNENQNNIYDFYITGVGIRKNQGNPWPPDIEPAGNCFSKNANNPYSDFDNQANWGVTYLYYNLTDCENPTSICNVSKTVTSTPNTCLSHFNGNNINIPILTPEQEAALKQEFANYNSADSNVSALYSTLKDGGNTEALAAEIAASTQYQTMQLRYDLLSASPYLSEEILKAAADKYDVLPNNILFDILAANPDELKNEELLQYMREKQNPLSEDMIDSLKSIANGSITDKTLLQLQMATFDSKKMRAAYTIIRNLLSDSITEFNTVRNWFGNLHNINSDFQIIDSWFHEGNTSSVIPFLDSLPQRYNLAGDALNEYNYYNDLKLLQANMINKGRNIFQLTSDERQTLENISENSHSIAGTQSQNILQFVFGLQFVNCAPLPDAPMRPFNPAIKRTYSNPEPTFLVFPNPAKEWTAIIYSIPSNIENSYIEIDNMNGQKIDNFKINNNQGEIIWNTRKIAQGIYIYKLINNKYCKSGKITVIH